MNQKKSTSTRNISLLFALITAGSVFLPTLTFAQSSPVSSSSPSTVNAATPVPAALPTRFIVPLSMAVPTAAPSNSATSLATSNPVQNPTSSSPTTIAPLTLSAQLDLIAQSLLTGGFIRDKQSFLAETARITSPVLPGGYRITSSGTGTTTPQVMSNKQIVDVLLQPPYMKWIVVPPGLRKEEIADLLATNLGWNTDQRAKWLKATTLKYDNIEGVYFPDTYLIPVDEQPTATAKRLVAKFNEKFAPYLPQFRAQNIQWIKGLTLASIVQREAANASDMPLIAGILLNRLNQKMPLQVDATLQYVRGLPPATVATSIPAGTIITASAPKGWWAPITLADKKTDSPYNTYKHAGLPPHPISNPGLAAIQAVLHPATTNCLYYLHDHNRVTHCAATYPEHQQNINQYLKSNPQVPAAN